MSRIERMQQLREHLVIDRLTQDDIYGLSQLIEEAIEAEIVSPEKIGPITKNDEYYKVNVKLVKTVDRLVDSVERHERLIKQLREHNYGGR
jgi:hypothetical protein